MHCCPGGGGCRKGFSSASAFFFLPDRAFAFAFGAFFPADFDARGLFELTFFFFATASPAVPSSPELGAFPSAWCCSSSYLSLFRKSIRNLCSICTSMTCFLSFPTFCLAFASRSTTGSLRLRHGRLLTPVKRDE